MTKIRTRIACKDGLAQCNIFVNSRESGKPQIKETKGTHFEIDPGVVSSVTISPVSDALWETRLEDFATLGDLICLPELPTAMGIDWFHRILGFSDVEEIVNYSPKNRVKIGVVDLEFSPEDTVSKVASIDLHRKIREQFLSANSTAPSKHAESIVRLIANNPAPSRGKKHQGRVGVSPWADVKHFSSARVVNDELTNDPSALMDGIETLADWGANIINLSCGLTRLPDCTSDDIINQFQKTITNATKNGATIVAAAGNAHNSSRIKTEKNTPYPASDPRCITVAGIDSLDAPLPPDFSTAASDLAKSAYTFKLQLREGQTFQLSEWSRSVLSPCVDCVAPANGLIVDKDGRPGWDVRGTSFAAPLVSGLLALLIDQDDAYWEAPLSRRFERAREILTSSCVNVPETICSYMGSGLACIKSEGAVIE